jgi:hypothetical protein
MGPLAGEQLRPDAPAGDVGDLENRLQIVRQMGEHGSELARLEETLAHVVLTQHRHVRPACHQAGDLAQTEHWLQDCQFTVDRRIRRALGLALAHVRDHALRRDGSGPHLAEVGFEVSTGILHTVVRAAAVDHVVVVEILARLRTARSSGATAAPFHPGVARRRPVFRSWTAFTAVMKAMSLGHSRIVVSSRPMDALSYFEATCRARKSRIRPAISSTFVSRAKWPASSR